MLGVCLQCAKLNTSGRQSYEELSLMALRNYAKTD